MNKSKWLTLGFMLLALFFISGISPPTVSAVSKPSDFFSDGCIAKVQETYSQHVYSNPAERAYVVYKGSDRYMTGYYLVCFCEPEYFFNGGSGGYSWLSCQYTDHTKCKNKFELGHHGATVYRIIDKGVDSTCTVYKCDATWSFGSGNEASYSMVGMGYDSMFTDLIACNLTLKNEDGKIFFYRTPLAANWQTTADQAIQEKLVEVRENKPRLPQLGQIQTGLIVVVCCLVSLILLSKLLRVWKSSVIR